MMINLFLSLSIIVPSALSLSSGAPSSACRDGIPRHFVMTPQNTPPPYDLLVTNDEDEDFVKVTIQGKTQQDTIRGFLIRAKLDGQDVGSFEVAPGDNYSQVFHCSLEKQTLWSLILYWIKRIMSMSGFGIGGNEMNAVTHKFMPNGISSVTVNWLPGTEFIEDVTFEATIVQRYDLFWVGVKSNLQSEKFSNDVMELES